VGEAFPNHVTVVPPVTTEFKVCDYSELIPVAETFVRAELLIPAGSNIGRVSMAPGTTRLSRVMNALGP